MNMNDKTSDTASQPLLRLRDITLGYDGNTLYSNVNLSVGRGELVTLIGANGAGKSTLLRCVTGSLHPISGVVMIDGRNLDTITNKDLAQLVSVVNTERIMAGALTVREVASLGRQPYTGFFGRLGQRDYEIVSKSLEDVGMTAFADRQLASLSDGERQKVMIARALAQETPVIVLDEPTAFLDVASRIETMQLLSSLAKEEGKAVILSSHDVGSALRMSQRLWLITGGTPPRILDGTPAQLIEEGALGKLFPGRSVTFDRSSLDFVSEH